MNKTGNGGDARPVLLVIGNIQFWEAQGLSLPHGDGIFFLSFAELTSDRFLTINPDVVLSGLINAGFDAVDVAEALGKLGFQGRYRVVTEDIPKPRIVQGDVRAVAPDVDFDLINLAKGLEDILEAKAFGDR